MMSALGLVLLVFSVVGFIFPALLIEVGGWVVARDQRWSGRRIGLERIAIVAVRLVAQTVLYVLMERPIREGLGRQSVVRINRRKERA
jgi:hypothetical protein